MKFKGESFVKRNHKIVEIYREDDDGNKHTFEFIVCPLPSGWRRRMKMVGVMEYPTPPKKAMKFRNGKAEVHMKGPNGQAVVEDDEDDPEYIRKTSIVSNRLRALQFAAVIRDDNNWSFESVPPDNDTEYNKEAWDNYADQLIDELDSSGLTDEEISHIIREASSIANSANVSEAIESFLDLG